MKTNPLFLFVFCIGLSGCSSLSYDAEPDRRGEESVESLPAEPLSWSREGYVASPLPAEPRAAITPASTQSPSGTDSALSLPDDSPFKAARQASREHYHPLVEQVADEFGLDAGLLHAMILVESNYQSAAISPKGARGLMQVMPATGERFGYRDLLNPQHNLRAGASYLQWLIKHFDNNLTLALAGYNAGEGAVKRHGRAIPPYAETQNYVKKVMVHYQQPLLPSVTMHKKYALPPAAGAVDKTEKVVINGLDLAAKLLGLLLSTPAEAQTPQHSADISYTL